MSLPYGHADSACIRAKKQRRVPPYRQLTAAQRHAEQEGVTSEQGDTAEGDGDRIAVAACAVGVRATPAQVQRDCRTQGFGIAVLERRQGAHALGEQGVDDHPEGAVGRALAWQ